MGSRWNSNCTRVSRGCRKMPVRLSIPWPVWQDWENLSLPLSFFSIPTYASDRSSRLSFRDRVLVYSVTREVSSPCLNTWAMVGALMRAQPDAGEDTTRHVQRLTMPKRFFVHFFALSPSLCSRREGRSGGIDTEWNSTSINFFLRDRTATWPPRNNAQAPLPTIVRASWTSSSRSLF